MSTYKLTYLNARGKGEYIRLVLAAAGVQYEDFRIDLKDWPQHKSSTFILFELFALIYKILVCMKILDTCAPRSRVLFIRILLIQVCIMKKKRIVLTIIWHE